MLRHSILRTHSLRLLTPAAMLMMLLQRAPMLRVLVSADFATGASRLGQMLRATFPAVAGALAVNTLTGATRFTTNPVSPATATQGSAFAATFAVTGTPSNPKSYTVTGLPAGLTVPSGTLSGTKWTVNGLTGTITGTPTVSGSFTVGIQAWEKVGATGDKSPVFDYVINIAGSATAPPAFTTQPVSQTVTAGGSASFTVAASGTPAPTYQWRKGGVNLAGRTSANLSLTNVSLSAAGNYDCVATNSAGATTSAAATLAVTAATVAPVFSTPPTSQSVTTGGSVSFTVVTSGTPAPTLQWRKDGVNLAGRSSASLSLTNVMADDAGSYDCVATNAAGSVTSAAATLTVVVSSSLRITVQPASMRSLAGGDAFFSTQATGSGLTYQWLQNGATIPRATGSSLYVAGVQAGNAGTYTVVVTDTFGAQVTSAAASLTIASSGSARLVNLSARAGVGTGADVLIPGFVIEGDVALTLLIRGIGPYLANYDVTNVLEDPVMSLFQGSTQLATNDDWEESPDLVALNGATAVTGAFPLATGGKDCAMLLTLNPGVYTVQVTGKDGMTGVALVELYVVDR